MRFNPTFIGHFVGGILALYLSWVIVEAGNSGGFFFKAVGGEAYLKGFFLCILGLGLVTVPFRNKLNDKVTFKDINIMFCCFLATEIIPHAIFLLI